MSIYRCMSFEVETGRDKTPVLVFALVLEWQARSDRPAGRPPGILLGQNRVGP